MVENTGEDTLIPFNVTLGGSSQLRAFLCPHILSTSDQSNLPPQRRESAYFSCDLVLNLQDDIIETVMDALK